MTRTDERQMVAAYIATRCNGGPPFEVRNRDFSHCSLVGSANGMSRTQLKLALRWLIAAGYVRRFRFDLVERNGEQVRVPVEVMSHRGGYFSEADELWVYRPTETASGFLCQSE